MNTDKIARWFFADRIPVTKALMVTNALTFIGIYVIQSSLIVAYGAFMASEVMQKPWTAITFPLIGCYGCAGGAVFSLAFSCYWLWVAGGSLERSWGSVNFAAFFAKASVLTAAGVYVGMLLTGASGVLWGLWTPLAAVTVAFAALNPEQTILLMFVLPIKLKYVGMLSAAALMVSMATFHPLVGVCSLLGCAFAYWFVRTGRQYGGSSRRQPRGQVVRVHQRESILSRLNPLRGLERRRSEKKLKKLFEDSGLGEDDRNKPKE